MTLKEKVNRQLEIEKLQQLIESESHELIGLSRGLALGIDTLISYNLMLNCQKRLSININELYNLKHR